MATNFSDGRSRSTRREPPTMGKQLVNFITCGCESSALFFVIYKAGREPTPYWSDYWQLRYIKFCKLLPYGHPNGFSTKTNILDWITEQFKILFIPLVQLVPKVNEIKEIIYFVKMSWFHSQALVARNYIFIFNTISFIISSLFPLLNLFVSIFMQSYVNSNLHVSILYICW